MDSNTLDVTGITRRTYDLIAPAYVQKINSLVSDSWVGRFEKSLLDKFSVLLENRQGKSLIVLDIGCGGGKDSSYLSHKRGITAVGLDYSGGMLREARRAFPSIDFVRMDMRRLSFREDSFQGAWANGCIYHVPKKDLLQVFWGVKKVLKPGGMFSFNFKSGSGEQIEENPGSYGGNPRFYAYYEADEMPDLLSQAGFNTIETQDYPAEIFGEKIRHVWAEKPF
ncbi:MAG: class I SAM-dependent methyltransferase [Dehalococcoidales bacterium]|nr:class I SAM-dependent methyltransferase [Dehalococcoidales bacterium]